MVFMNKYQPHGMLVKAVVVFVVVGSVSSFVFPSSSQRFHGHATRGVGHQQLFQPLSQQAIVLYASPDPTTTTSPGANHRDTDSNVNMLTPPTPSTSTSTSSPPPAPPLLRPPSEPKEVPVKPPAPANMFERTLLAVGMNRGMKNPSKPTYPSLLMLISEDTPSAVVPTSSNTVHSSSSGGSSSGGNSSDSGSNIGSSSSGSSIDNNRISATSDFGLVSKQSQTHPSSSSVLTQKDTTTNPTSPANPTGTGTGTSTGTGTATLSLGGINLLGGINKEQDVQTMRKELTLLKLRLDKVEKTSATLALGKTKTPVGSFVDSLAANTLAMNARTVEVCSTVAFFAIGTVVGASLLDRLWLLGGLVMGWWASGAVHRDTRGGMVARRVGVTVAQMIRDIQEKYNQFVIFYQTGKLAYHSSKIWEQWDAQFSITQRTDELKRLAMQRATDFNTRFKDQGYLDTVGDIWKVIVSAPDRAQRINKEFGVTSSVVAFGKGLWGGVVEGVGGVVARGRELSGAASGVGVGGGWTLGGVTRGNNLNSNRFSSSSSSSSSPFGSSRSATSSGLGSRPFGSLGVFSTAQNSNNAAFGSSWFSSPGSRKSSEFKLFWWLNDRQKQQGRGMSFFSSLFPSSRPNYRGRPVNPWVPFWAYLGRTEGGGNKKRGNGGRGAGNKGSDYWNPAYAQAL